MLRHSDDPPDLARLDDRISSCLCDRIFPDSKNKFKGRHPTRSSVRGGFARGPLLLTLCINRVPLLRRMRVAPSQQRQQSRVQ